MLAEVDIYGVYVPVFLLLATAALAATRLFSHLLGKAGLARFIWHRAMFDLAMFVMITRAGLFLLERMTK